MKKTQIIDAWRNVGKQKVSYISIILIAMFALTCYTGVRFGAKGLAEGASDFYDKQNFRDFEIISAVMFSDDDLKAIADIEGVSDAEGVLRTTGKVTSGDVRSSVVVLSATERVNLPEIVEGVLPAAAEECALESDLAQKLGAKIGDTLNIEDTGSDMKLLKQKEFRVTGIVIHPDHFVKPNPFEDYVIVGKSAFDGELLDGRSVYAEVVIDKPAGTDRFSGAYTDLIAAVSPRLEKQSAELANSTLLKVWKQLEGYKTLFREQIFRPLMQAWVVYAKKCTPEEARALVDGLDWAEELSEPDLSVGDLDAGRIPVFSDFSFTLPAKNQLAQSATEQLKSAAEALRKAGLTELNVDIPSENVERIQKILDGLDLSVYDKLLSVVKLWNTGHTRYLATLEKLAGGAASLSDFNGVWMIFDANMNPGYMHAKMSVEGLAAIAIRFTLLFIIVGAIVIYSTIGKLVDEQKKLVGAAKAFGFFNREIFCKYLIFGGSATLIGSILGSLAGIFLLEFFVEYAYGRYYVMGTAPRTVIVWQLILIIAAGLLLAVAAVWFASTKLLRSTAVSLMQDAVPAVKRRAKKKGKSRLSLYSRLILRNMRTDAKRVLVTVVSIAGSCALMLIGFSIFFSVRKTVSVQFDGIVKYDSIVSVDTGGDTDALESVRSALEKEGADALPVRFESGAFRSGTGTEPAEFIAGDLSEVSTCYVLRDPDSGQTLSVDEGVLLPSSYAEEYGLKTGDECILVSSSGGAYTVKIGGIFENYMGRTILFGKNGYRQAFGKDAENNSLLVKHPGIDRNDLSKKLKAVDGFSSIGRSDSLRVLFNSYSDLIAIMMVIMIAAAGMMSAVILTNLVNICILQKKRELTVMRVNGFTTKEVKNYITREALVTSAAGVILGTVLGLLQFRAIMPALGKSYAKFILTPDIAAILIAAAITTFFTVVVYRFALRKIKNLKLTDIA